MSRGEEFDEVWSDPSFSPQGKALVYAAKKDRKWFVVVGEKKGQEFDFVWPPTFSLDGTRVAYGARKGRELWWKVLSLE